MVRGGGVKTLFKDLSLKINYGVAMLFKNNSKTGQREEAMGF